MASIKKEALITMYTKMLTIRRFEERAVREYGEGAIPGLIHSYIGQEAVAVGVCAHLRTLLNTQRRKPFRRPSTSWVV